MIKIMLDDSKIPYKEVYEHFANVADWAAENCPSYQSYETVDVSDFSVTNDVIAEYVFADARDATMFRLRWL